jgi:hypothetical protein
MRWLLAVTLVACGSSSSAIDATTHASLTAVCMHICMCEAATVDAGTDSPLCETDCNGNGTSSTSSSLSSSVSLSSFTVSSGDLVTADQACMDCFNAASCADIVNGSACASTCN